MKRAPLNHKTPSAYAEIQAAYQENYANQVPTIDQWVLILCAFSRPWGSIRTLQKRSWQAKQRA